MSFNISLIPFCFSHQTVTAVTDLAIKLSEVFVLTNEFVLWQSLQAEKLVDFLITAWILMRLAAEVHSILSFCEHSNFYWVFFCSVLRKLYSSFLVFCILPTLSKISNSADAFLSGNVWNLSCEYRAGRQHPCHQVQHTAKPILLTLSSAHSFHYVSVKAPKNNVTVQLLKLDIVNLQVCIDCCIQFVKTNEQRL